MALKKFIGFALAGGTATLLNFSIFLALMAQGVPVLAASAIGYVSGIAVSFLLNKSFVFKSSTRISLIRYIGLYVMALLLQLIVLAGLIEFGLDPFFANGISVTTVLIGNYFAMRLLVFKDPMPKNSHKG